MELESGGFFTEAEFVVLNAASVTVVGIKDGISSILGEVKEEIYCFISRLFPIPHAYYVEICMCWV